jgi:DivIVA domain-containing protein
VAKRGTIDRVMLVWVVVIIALIGAVVVVAVGRGGAMSEVYDDRPDATVPDGRPLTADDLRDVSFSTAVRGYRMDEVDALIARVRADLIARESAAPTHAGPPAEQPTTAEPSGLPRHLPTRHAAVDADHHDSSDDSGTNTDSANRTDSSDDADGAAEPTGHKSEQP